MKDHKNWVSGVFDRAAPNYGKKSASFFDDFGKSLTEQINIIPGSKALDVATGKGAVLFPLAQAIGPAGKVIGIDISRQMIEQTINEAKEKKLDWIDLQQMDAEHLSFPDHFFDFVFCGFALFFFPSVPTALAEFKRVLKPGGKLAVSTWGEDSGLDQWVNQETKKLCAGKSLVATPLWSEAELRAALNNAHFSTIQIHEETRSFMHRTAEEWWESLWTHATRAKLELLSSDQLADLHKRAIRKAKEFDKGQGIEEQLHVIYGIAEKTK